MTNVNSLSFSILWAWGAGGFKAISTKGELSKIKTQGFLQTNGHTNKDTLWKSYLSLPQSFCYLRILLTSRRGQVWRGRKKSAQTSEKRFRTKVCSMECGKGHSQPLLCLSYQLDTWASQQIKTRSPQITCSATKCPVLTAWNTLFQLCEEGMAGTLGVQTVTGVLMTTTPNSQVTPETSQISSLLPSTILLSDETLAPQISFSTTAVQLPVTISIFFLNVHSLCLELIRRDAIKILRKTMFLHAAAGMGCSAVTQQICLAFWVTSNWRPSLCLIYSFKFIIQSSLSLSLSVYLLSL